MNTRGLGIYFDINIEFNNGWASQVQVQNCNYHLVQREKLTHRLYFETSHGKSMSDGLG